ncbi:lipoate--protein ligase [Tissierellaceae bacterium HCP3S3_D8]
MKYVENYSNDPKYNLAFEEYCFKNLSRDEDYVILWINGPAIIVGKNQNTAEEINGKYVEENNIKVVRRVTGGGAVYHDLGNLNFSIITNLNGNRVIDFKKYNIPILKALEKLGVNCELSGRNDITIDGKKFSGIAQSIWKDRVLNHGTLLFDTKLDVLSKALNVKKDKIESKGIKSVKSRVTNIKPYIKEDIDMEEFRSLLLKYIFEMEGFTPEKYELSEEEKTSIDKLYREKYSTWEWNYGKSPKFNLKNYKRFSFGAIDIRLDVKGGIIQDCKIFGDFFGAEDVKDLEDKLKGKRYDRGSLSIELEDEDLIKYFGNITLEEFIDLIFV